MYLITFRIFLFKYAPWGSPTYSILVTERSGLTSVCGYLIPLKEFKSQRRERWKYYFFLIRRLFHFYLFETNSPHTHKTVQMIFAFWILKIKINISRLHKWNYVLLLNNEQQSSIDCKKPLRMSHPKPTKVKTKQNYSLKSILAQCV